MVNSKAITVSLLVVKVMRILVTIMAVLATVFIIIQLIIPVPFTVSFPVSFDVYEINSETAVVSSYHKIDVGPFKFKSGNVPDSDTIIEEATGQIKIGNVSKSFLFIFFLFFILFIAPVYFVLIHLKKFLNSVAQGNPFISDNVKRFRIFGTAAIGLALLAGIAKFAGGFYISSNINLPGNLSLVHRFDFNWELIFLGIILFVIAESFRIGISVKTENDLTI